ncbi:LHFPL tetraspan subfamily member 2 protein-like [Lingula anatina]|uniref:LHFPL tetraspan subfamily member 2 protein n=1 Tax=Lingula anatina TaxID=7574 RepID=A0A1S3HL43_LINAN|nr:LHFPL tetraspan subfamily member 2 protein [Lingula anatina]XP_013385722.1 LHFPL tetraspan subfamily member 2 protein [Lingula anatina]XP_013385723.1 LHFPL tetraspan subfamily member 2 protein [Lingula anatina]XP_013385725.1 LHFPL tetraspan subfamily member 2 protein [Lingula anatina]XP_013385726.1 LHFPL tetraspan subfamily member 2 protein [Lingula anatina]XP_013385727.1 LHFPL tetraspan subfamily member 2 protein [Lingula anatina]XP_013385728.1 LHFPL tetraspan subfamily member 2 protein [|eukprot:XP_013385721.1 LHFPL tetraspan subfamily member 2 protein [Lingula anatina]
MCYVIITVRSLLWTLLTLVATMAVVSSLISPYWIMGTQTVVDIKPVTNDSSVSTSKETFQSSIGIYTRCTKLHLVGRYVDNCASFIEGAGFDMDSEQFSHFWKACLFMYGVGLALLTFTVITAVLSLCVRAICKKSIFTVSGLIQSIAGLFLIVAILLYPAGWGSTRVRRECGDTAAPFELGDCSLGWSFYCCIGGTILVFICSVLSIQAERATSSDKVEAEILDGKYLVCVL